MTEAEFQKLKATMPWMERSYRGPKGRVIIQILDNAGQEVPLFAMTAFLTMITAKLAAKTGRGEGDAQASKADEGN